MSRAEQSMERSSADFLAYVWPAVRGHLGGGSIEPVEAVTAEGTTKNLDVLAGIDVWHYLDGEVGMRGIGSRVQWLYPDNPRWESRWPWRTFTVRKSTSYGNTTEYEKRLAAIDDDRGLLYPHLTVQAYVHTRGSGPLDAAAVVRTSDLIRHIDRHGADVVPGRAGQTFYSVPWDVLRCRGVAVGEVGSAARRSTVTAKTQPDCCGDLEFCGSRCRARKGAA